MIWIGFVVLVLGLLALDLGIFHRSGHAIRFKEAVVWSVVWTLLALAFNVFVYFL
jgi:tellurite resistance protein TerC